VTGRDERSPESREDAEWRAIVENFGERVELPEPPPEPESPRSAAPDPGPAMELPAELAPLPWDDEGHYVPPEPPPLPRPQGLRLVAWFGLFGVPTLALLCVVLGISIPSLVGLLLVCWFVGGFGYLVATMSSRDPDSGWDDGAVL
jgi:hypothetical protein